MLKSTPENLRAGFAVAISCKESAKLCNPLYSLDNMVAYKMRQAMMEYRVNATAS